MPRRSFAALVSVCVLFTWNSAPFAVRPTAAPAVRDASARRLIWSDEFGGAAGTFTNHAGWTLATGGGGWGNHERECYTTSRSNASTNGKGQLVITALRTPGHLCADGHRNSFTSARITTQASFTVTHGRLEIRAKLPSGAGAWPAFWAIGADQAEVGWPRCGEIDVMEYTGNRPTVTTSAAHLARYAGPQWYTTRVAPASTTLATRFHVYAVDWTSNSLTFFRDNVVTGVITRAQVVRHGIWPFDRPFYLLLNLAMGGTYAGSVPARLTSPQRYVIDYVRVYR